MVLVALLALDRVMDLTQSRPELDVTPARTSIQLSIAQHGARQPAGDTAEALWVACRPILAGQGPREAAIVPGERRVVRVELVPGIGELTTRRLTGCLADALIPHVQAQVVAVNHSS
jgi:hypothetical protein